MKFNKIISIIAAAVFVPCSVFAYPASGNDVTFDAEGYVILNGVLEGASAGTKILVSVIPDGATMEDVLTDNTKLIYTDEIFTDESGQFTLKFKMNDNRVDTGRYNINLFGENVDTAITKSFLYTTAADLEEINGIFEKDFTKDDIIMLLNDYAENIKLTAFSIFNDVNGDNLANNVYESAKKQQIDNLSDFNVLVWKLAYVEAYNQGKTELIVDSEYNLKEYTEYGVPDAALKEQFEESVNFDGKKTVIESVIQKNYKNYEEWYNDFGESLFVQRIVNSSSTGYAHVKDIFAEENIYGLDLSEYKTLSETNKRKAESKLVSEDAKSIEDLQKNLDDIIDDIKNGKTQSGSSGSSGTSGGSSGISGFPYPGENTDNVTLHVVDKNESNEDNAHDIKYSDIENYKWAEEAIMYLSEKGIVNGVGNGLYDPGREITREEFVKMIITAFSDIPNNDYAKSGFSDDPGDAWYSPYLRAAEDSGIINGYNDGSFGIGKKINREECATIIYRAAKEKYPDYFADNAEKFEDDSDISDYAKEGVYKLAAAGVIKGMGNNRFMAKNPATRAEAAVMIYGIIKS